MYRISNKIAETKDQEDILLFYRVLMFDLYSYDILYIVMGFFSFGSSKGRIGIDIGTSSIKIIELTKESNRFQLANYGMYKLEPGDEAIMAGQSGRGKISQLSNENIISGIKSILQSTGIKSRDVVASIPSYPTFSTTITMPFLSEEEIAKAIPFEARKYIPIPISEVQLDWAIVSVKKDQLKTAILTSRDTKGQPTVDVFLVAVPKIEVKRYQDIMKGAELNLRALELENFALIRSIVGNDLSPISILNVGGRSTSILIVENGFQRSNHDYEIGGYEITNTIARSLNINLSRAEQMQKSLGMRETPDNLIRDSIASLIDSIAFEATKSIHNYEDLRKVKITKTVLVGGIASMPDVVPYFSKKLEREVVLGNPLARIVCPPSLDPLKRELNATFSVSLGLAMREI